MKPSPRISAQVRKLRKQSSLGTHVIKEPLLSPPASRAKSRKLSGAASKPDRTIAESKLIWLDWFKSQDWTPFPFQEKVWQAYLNGESGLLSVPTGSGKTYAAFGGPFIDLLSYEPLDSAQPLVAIYISPLKALVRDIAQALMKPISDLKLPYHVEIRTGDTSQAARARLRERLPHILITTPESFGLLLAEKDAEARLSGVRALVVDEWHELLGTKRGSLLELTVARLREFAPHLKTWALSATIANLPTAAKVAVGLSQKPTLIAEKLKRTVRIDSILPASKQNFPWYGHSGLRLADDVVAQIDTNVSTLIFTNTRSQAERWFHELLRRRPDWESILALHHGSIDRAERERVENGVKSGALRVVVATSSLDLGVDFPQVEKAIQIGSTKGLARALQRAGRAFHQPGKSTVLTVLPTNQMEILEVAALRTGLAAGELENREPLKAPLDVLVQFVLNCAFGRGFRVEKLLQTVQSTYSFSDVSAATFDRIKEFTVLGGTALQAYPQFQKLVEVDGRFVFANPRVARLHRLNMGTILSDGGVLVKFPKGQTLGVIDESFIAKIKPGQSFQFSGRTLQLIQLRDMNALVRLSKAKDVTSSVWNGTLFPISAVLSKYLRQEVAQLSEDLDQSHSSPEQVAFRPAALIQRRLSQIPAMNELLIETMTSRDGHHLFIYPFEGRLVHEGLGHLLAFRLSQLKRNTISVSATDYGFELLAAEPFGDVAEIKPKLTDVAHLETDIQESLNFPELAKRAFREVARVSGLIQQGIPGKNKSIRQLQMSSSLLFDVFKKYEPDHPLLYQAEQDVRTNQLQLERLTRVMEQIAERKFILRRLDSLTPFSFPLYLERVKSRLSTESLEDRIERIRSDFARQYS